MSGLTGASTSIQLASARATLYRAPVDVPMLTSFGVLRERPALFVEVTDDDGARGWGKIWCNFPLLVAEHRLEFVRTVGMGRWASPWMSTTVSSRFPTSLVLASTSTWNPSPVIVLRQLGARLTSPRGRSTATHRTPPGAGMGTPPRYPAADDALEGEIEDIGRTRHPIFVGR